MINAEKFAEHIKMTIDSDRSKHDYYYNLAAELKAEEKGIHQLSDALEQDFDDLMEQIATIPDSEYLTTVLNKVFNNSDFLYQLSKMIWEDERVSEILNQ